MKKRVKAGCMDAAVRSDIITTRQNKPNQIALKKRNVNQKRLLDRNFDCEKTTKTDFRFTS